MPVWPGSVRRTDHAVGRLRRAPARRLQRPGERAVVGVDPHRVRQTVDRQPVGAQRTGRRRRRVGIPATGSAAPTPAPGPGSTPEPRRPCARCDGAGGDTGRGGQEGAAAEAAHGDPAPDRDHAHRRPSGVGVEQRPASPRPRSPPASPSASRPSGCRRCCRPRSRRAGHRRRCTDRPPSSPGRTASRRRRDDPDDVHEAVGHERARRSGRRPGRGDRSARPSGPLAGSPSARYGP